ncbi:hypothetical protein HGRIS_007322 [Hohenbuehelia grisea]|uniref:F-box domain-containing protein n=1 Tax=Hohenbuehelia grisea TaxID=104357 RepID=A0ABR3J4T6_9AGAR
MVAQHSITLPFSQRRLSSLDTPEFPHLLTNNAPPNPQNASILRQELSAASKDLEAIDIEVPQLLAALKALHTRRTHLAGYVKRYQSVISPIRRLPAEILSEIFLLCRKGQRANILDTTQFPWPLTRVCSAWRSVAISTPGLWNTIAPEPIPKTAAGSKELVNRFIYRSRNAPLSVRLTSACMQRAFRSSLERIISTSPRWTEFTLSIDFSQGMPCNLRQLRGSLQSLEQLTIEGKGADGNVGLQNTVDVFWVAPMLKRVTIREVSLTHFQIPWIQITHLDYRNKTPTFSEEIDENEPDIYTFDVLRNVPQLTELHYNSLAVETDDMEPVVLPSLRALHIFNDSTFANCITAPSLRSLHIVSEDDGVPFIDINDLIPMLSRSRASLKTLVVRKTETESLDGDDILALLQHTPTLQQLDVKGLDDLDEDFFLALEMNPAITPPLVPDLKSITISSQYHSSSAVANNLLQFLESRCGNGKHSALTKARFCLSPSSFTLPSRAYWLKRLVDAGLDFATLPPLN